MIIKTRWFIVYRFKFLILIHWLHLIILFLLILNVESNFPKLIAFIKEYPQFFNLVFLSSFILFLVIIQFLTYSAFKYFQIPPWILILFHWLLQQLSILYRFMSFKWYLQSYFLKIRFIVEDPSFHSLTFLFPILIVIRFPWVIKSFN